MIPMIIETDEISRLLNQRNTAINQIEVLAARIRELEHQLISAKTLAGVFDAENQRLREALTLVATCGLEPIDDAYRRVAERALLGGGE